MVGKHILQSVVELVGVHLLGVTIRRVSKHPGVIGNRNVLKRTAVYVSTQQHVTELLNLLDIKQSSLVVDMTRGRGVTLTIHLVALPDTVEVSLQHNQQVGSDLSFAQPLVVPGVTLLVAVVECFATVLGSVEEYLRHTKEVVTELTPVVTNLQKHIHHLRVEVVDDKLLVRVHLCNPHSHSATTEEQVNKRVELVSFREEVDIGILAE